MIEKLLERIAVALEALAATPFGPVDVDVGVGVGVDSEKPVPPPTTTTEKRGRGRPPKTEVSPANATPKATAKPAATVEQAVAAAKSFGEQYGIDVLRSVLTKFDVPRVSQLPAEKLSDFISALTTEGVRIDSESEETEGDDFL